MGEFAWSVWFRKHYRVVLVPVVFVGYYFLVYLVNPYSEYWTFAKREPYDLMVELFGLLFLCYMIVVSCVYIANRLNAILPWEKRPLYRAVVQFTFHVVLILIIQYFMRITIRSVFFPEEFYDPFSSALPLMKRLDLWRYIIVGVAMSVLLNFVVTGNYFLNRWRNSMIEATELKVHAAHLKEIAMRAELQSLKLQLDPHFMFNNFSTLSALISEDRDLAQSFIEHLSKVYRYMIMNIHYNVISLQKELKFIQSYIYLIKIRHGDNVIITIDIPEALLDKQIPPITLQLLVENAIKHNIASASQPLHVSIYTEDSARLVVSNNLQRISEGSLSSSQIGLKNIKDRYRLVFGQEPQVVESENKFLVSLPLLD